VRIPSTRFAELRAAELDRQRTTYQYRLVQPAAEKSGTVRSTAEDHWAALGFDLGGLLTEAWGMPASRMDIHTALDTTSRYDVVSAPPIPEPAKSSALNVGSLNEGKKKHQEHPTPVGNFRP
jgi:hypothetical protein